MKAVFVLLLIIHEVPSGSTTNSSDASTTTTTAELLKNISVDSVQTICSDILAFASNIANDTKKGALNAYADTLGDIVNRMNSSKMTENQVETASKVILNAIGTVMTSFRNCDPQADSVTCSRTNMAGKMEQLQDSVLQMGDVLTRSQRDVDVTMNTKTVSTRFKKMIPSKFVQDPVESKGASVKLPENIVDAFSDEHVTLKVVVYDDVSFVPSTTASSSVSQTGPVITCRLTDEHKNSVRNVDPDDPVVLGATPSAMSDPHRTSHPSSIGEDSISCEKWTQGDFLLLEYELQSDVTLSLIGRFEESPTESVYDFSATVTSATASVKNAHSDVKVQTTGASARVYVMDRASKYQRLCVRASYSGAQNGSSSGRSRRSVSAGKTSPTMSVTSLTVTVWDPDAKAWVKNNSVTLYDVDAAGKVQFKSSFFGTFSLSEMVIAPTMIDFEAIFLDFEQYLHESPYVLAVICLLFVITSIVCLILRRLDVADNALWTYLPLVDNNDHASFVYTMSVHTALSSPRHTTVTPFFVLNGQYGSSGIRVLVDGVRENFRGGTESNFILKSPISLGPLLKLRIWHDNNGKNPHWKLNRVVVTDCATKETTLFICREWLSTAKGDGKVSRHLPALVSDLEDRTGTFDMVSEHRLFDDHLWLSLAKRPAYSTFTRVQRFLCAVALLFLAMVSNAMFYQGKEADREDLKGVKIGPVQINYRQLFVGAVSAVIVVIPALIMTQAFKRRKVKSIQDSSVTTSFPATNAAVITSLPMPTTPILTFTSDMELVPLQTRYPPVPERRGAPLDVEYSGATREFEHKRTGLHGEDNAASSPPVSVAYSAETSPALFGSDVDTKEKPRLLESSVDGTAFHLEDAKGDDNTGLQAVRSAGNVDPDIYISGQPNGSLTTTDKTGDTKLEKSHILTTKTSSPYELDNFAFYAPAMPMNKASTNEEKGDTRTTLQTSRARSGMLLPWWFIFVGYFFVVLSILAGAFFTFMYSLQWGGRTSLDWLLALFFSTSSGAVVIEPVKIVLVSVLLSCVFRQSARDEISAVAPYSPHTLNSPVFCPDQIRHITIVPEPDGAEDLLELERRRKTILLNQRLYGLLYRLGAQGLYVTLLCALCLHKNVFVTYQQNETIKNQLALSALEKVDAHFKVWDWMRNDLVPSLLPLYHYNGDHLNVKQQRFLADQSNYRVGPVTVTQYRVKGHCDVAPVIKKRGNRVRCIDEYKLDTKETSSFSQGWTHCKENCTDTGFLYDPGDESAIVQESRLTVYGPGGYRVVLAQRQRIALHTLTDLQTQGWLDEKSRALSIEVNLFNPNTRLFTQAKLLLEFPATGGCLPTSSLRTARLYPYINVWDYIILILQLVFIVVVVVRLCLALKKICFPAGSASRCGEDTVVVLLELACASTAIATYIVRIDRTIYAVEKLRNEPGAFTSFDMVFFLDSVYVLCLGCCLFVSILRFLEPISFNYHFYMLRRTLLRSRWRLIGLGLTLFVVLNAFIFLFYLYEGPVTHRWSSYSDSFLTLLTVLLTMTKYPELKPITGGDSVQAFVHCFMFVLFCMTAILLILNFAITILNSLVAETKDKTAQEDAAAHNGDLSEFIWNKLDKICCSCFGGGHTRLEEAEDVHGDPSKEADTSCEELERKLVQMIGLLTTTQPMDPEEHELREMHGELSRTRNRLKQIELEAEQCRTEANLLKVPSEPAVSNASDVDANVNASFPDKQSRALRDRIRHRCLQCQFTSASISKLRDHQETHSRGGIFTCRRFGCGAIFLERYKLICHLQKKHRYPLVCNWCGQAFKTYDSLHNHMPLHFLRPFVCPNCGMKFTTRHQKDGHRFIAH